MLLLRLPIGLTALDSHEVIRFACAALLGCAAFSAAGCPTPVPGRTTEVSAQDLD